MKSVMLTAASSGKEFVKLEVASDCMRRSECEIIVQSPEMEIHTIILSDIDVSSDPECKK